jgi:hypothetical protein
MAVNKNGDSTDKKVDPAIAKLELDIDADLKRLKTSSRFLAVVLVLLALAFLVLLVLSLGGYFEIQQTVGTISVLNRLYPDKEITVYKESTEVSPEIGRVGPKDMIFEIQPLPGFVEIRANKLIALNKPMQGWVRAPLLKTKVDQVALSKAIDRIKPLELLVQISTSKNDILVQGNVINNLDAPVKNIRLEITYLDDDLTTVSSEITNLSPKDEVKQGGTVSFSLLGKDLIKKSHFITCEIKDFDLVPSTIVVKGSEGASLPAPEEPSPPK